MHETQTLFRGKVIWMNDSVSREVDWSELTSQGTDSDLFISREVCSLGSDSRGTDSCEPVSKEVNPVALPSREVDSRRTVSREADSDMVVSHGDESFEAVSCETALRKINSNRHLLSSENNYLDNNRNNNDDRIELNSNQCFNILINKCDDDIRFFNAKLPQLTFSCNKLWLDNKSDKILPVSNDLSDDRVDSVTNGPISIN